ncbi:MAG: hypothetical protein IKM66_09160 [Clostridia bacterium]|nr:hypothetical protein [Clostridia bacterium]
MKKIISVILAVVMIFSIGSVAAFAAETYEVVFTEFPYDVAPFRSDYVGKYEGYEYGVDYWFTITNEDGTTTDIKGYPHSVQVEAGKALEFVVNLADYIEPTSVKIMAFPEGAEKEEDFYNTITGEPNGDYYVKRTSIGTYGVKPTENMTVCLSEFHLYNKAFLFDFPVSEFYTANRLFLTDPDATNKWNQFSYEEMGNTEVIFMNETLFFEVRIPKDGKHKYNYETYHVYYTDGDSLLAQKHYLRMPASEKNGTEEIDERYAHYETDTEWVDIYAIPNIPEDAQVKVANTVTYTIAMLDQFLQDFDLTNLDLSTVDLQPLLEYLLRLLNLLVKLLNSFGLNITLPDLLS